MDPQKELIQSAQKNIRNFSPLYREYHPKIHRFLKSRVNNSTEIADDLTSKTFEKAIKNIKSFRWQGISFSAWIYKIAHNTLIDYYRYQNKIKNKTTQIHQNIPDKSKSPEKVSQEIESASKIKTVIETLDLREQKIIQMKFYEGYQNKAIAKRLGISETNVGTILFRATRKLRERFLNDGNIDVYGV